MVHSLIVIMIGASTRMMTVLGILWKELVIIDYILLFLSICYSQLPITLFI